MAIVEVGEHMQEDETAGSKFRGSLINAVVFVAIVTVMTFVIVLLFKYGVCASHTNTLLACVQPRNKLTERACCAVCEDYLRIHGLCHLHDILHYDWGHCTGPSPDDQHTHRHPLIDVYTL